MSQVDDLGFDNPETPSAQATGGLLTVVWRRKSLVSLGVVLGVVGGILAYAQRPPVYQSTAQVMVIKKRGDPLPIAGGDPRLSYVEDYVSSHLVVIRSSVIVERAVKKRNLQGLHSFSGQGDPTGSIVAALGAARDNKDSTSGPNNIINLSYRGTVADDCPEVLNAIIESYKSFLDEAYHNVSDENLTLITAHRDHLKRELIEARSKHRSFRNQHASLIFTGSDGVNVHRKRANEAEEELTKLAARKTKLRGELANIDKAIAAGESRDRVLALVVPLNAEVRKGQPEAQPVRDRLILLRMEEAKLRTATGFSEGHPEVKAIRRQIALGEQLLQEAEEARGQGGLSWVEAVERAYSDPLERYVRVRRFELVQLEIEEQSRKQELEAVRREAIELDRHERDEAELREKVVSTEKELEETTKRLNEMNRVREAGGFEAQILARPGTGVKVAPILYQFLLGGCLMGLLAGLGLAYLVEAADKSFRTPEEIRRRLGLPVVGHIPVLTPDPEAVRKVDAGQVVPDPLLCCHYRPRSAEAEAYRAVRTAIYFSVEGAKHKVIQVTSPNQGDGKSTLAGNLAIAMAQSGKKVLIVDADCRRPRQHKVLGLAASVGLADVLAGLTGIDDAIRATATEGLSLLPCGSLPPNPAELLTSPRFQELLGELRQRYDFVLVDTPPLLAVTDPCVVAARVDAVLLTIRMSRKCRPGAVRAREILAALGVKILGVVVNGLDREGGSGLYQADNYGYTEEYTDGAANPPEPSPSGGEVALEQVER
jgi:capsular exopolysaccharide synthesis family protein